MPFFRKKPVVIEAVHFDGSNFNEVESLLKTGSRSYGLFYEVSEIAISTLEGVMNASKGDWIIKGISGEMYPCKPDIFEKTYEAVQ